MNLGKVDIENGKNKTRNWISGILTMPMCILCVKPLKKLVKAYKLTPHVYNKANPLFVDPNSELVQTLTSVYQAYSNDYETKNMTIGGGTYAKKFEHFVAYGPLFPKQDKPKGLVVGGCHQADEGIALSNLFTATAIYNREALGALAGEINMRMRKLPWAEEFLAEAEVVVKKPQDNAGKWKQLLSMSETLHVEVGTGKGDYWI